MIYAFTALGRIRTRTGEQPSAPSVCDGKTFRIYKKEEKLCAVASHGESGYKPEELPQG